MAVRAVANTTHLLSLDELRAQLRSVGEERYHHRHPFHLMMHEGRLSRGQLQAWALNRYYYQSMIPVKDSIILSRGPDPVFRRAWRKRVVDHDGDATSEGGIQRWLKLAETTGLDPERVRAGTGILPATRFAVNEYLNIVRNRSLLEAVASSLTELFSRDLISLRMEMLRQHYPWLSGGLDYFEARLTQAPEDAQFAVQLRFRECEDAIGTGTCGPGPARQVRHPVGATRRALLRLRAARLASARRISDRRGVNVAPPSDSSQPRLATGCRWGGTDADRVILFPEGAIKLQGTGRQVLEQCDGTRTFAEIIAELQKQFDTADPAKVRCDISQFLEQLRNKRIVDY